jgi:hypothetical protein
MLTLASPIRAGRASGPEHADGIRANAQARGTQREALTITIYFMGFTQIDRIGPTTLSDDTDARYSQGAQGTDRDPPQVGSSQPAKGDGRKLSIGAPRLIETRNRLHACIALRWNETRKKTVLRTSGGKRQGKEKLRVALA